MEHGGLYAQPIPCDHQQRTECGWHQGTRPYPPNFVSWQIRLSFFSGCELGIRIPVQDCLWQIISRTEQMPSPSAHSLALFASIAEATAFLTAPGSLALQHAMLASHSAAGCRLNALSTPAPIARVQHRRMKRSGARNLHASATATLVTPASGVLQSYMWSSYCNQDHFLLLATTTIPAVSTASTTFCTSTDTPLI